MITLLYATSGIHVPVPALAKLTMGTSPLDNTSSSGLRAWFDGQNWQVGAAIEALGDGTRLELSWQVSWNLFDWQPGPPATIVRHDGPLAVERITLTPPHPPFARLIVRRAR